jgi:hypothetical protein
LSRSSRGDRLALLSFVLIVPALATFVVGLASSGTLPLYVSLVCSVVAGVALAVAARLRRGDVEVVNGAPVFDAEPVDEATVLDAEPEEELVPAVSSFAPPDSADFALDVDGPHIDIEIPSSPPVPARQPRRRRKKRAAPVVTLPPPTPPPPPSRPAAAVTYDDEGSLIFPIEDYDRLSVAQVVKVLRLLDSEEMQTVRDYEAEHEARPDVLDRIDKLLTRRGLL